MVKKQQNYSENKTISCTINGKWLGVTIRRIILKSVWHKQESNCGQVNGSTTCCRHMEGTPEEKEDVSLFPVILLSLSLLLFFNNCTLFPCTLARGSLSFDVSSSPGEPKAVQHGGLSPSGPHAGAHLPSWTHCEFFLWHHFKKIWSETGLNSSAPFTKRKDCSQTVAVMQSDNFWFGDFIESRSSKLGVKNIPLYFTI